jgi:hypothetical protein
MSDGSCSDDEHEVQTLSHKKARHVGEVEVREEPEVDKVTSDDDDRNSETQASDEVTNNIMILFNITDLDDRATKTSRTDIA